MLDDTRRIDTRHLVKKFFRPSSSARPSNAAAVAVVGLVFSSAERRTRVATFCKNYSTAVKRKRTATSAALTSAKLISERAALVQRPTELFVFVKFIEPGARAGAALNTLPIGTLLNLSLLGLSGVKAQLFHEIFEAKYPTQRSVHCFELNKRREGTEEKIRTVFRFYFFTKPKWCIAPFRRAHRINFNFDATGKR